MNEVLDLSKISSGQVKLDEAPPDLAALLRDCNDLVGLQLTERKLTLSIALPDWLPPLMGDALRLKQVLLNLLSNAIKFSCRGDTVEVRVEITGPGDLTVSVMDRGIGMRPEDSVATNR